jgi:branched-chain amino acid transport system permease protein
MVLSGVMVGGVYSLVALGFVIIYKSTGVINFALGQLLAIGAMVLWTFLVPLSLPFWAASLLSFGCMAVVGILIERLCIRPMTGQPIMAVIVMTIGLSAFLDSMIPSVFGGVEQAYPPFFPSGGISFMGLSASYEYFLSFLMALLLVSIFLYFFHNSRKGITMRAVADGHDIARSCGVRVGSIFSLTWIIACVSVTVGGFLLGSIESVSPSLSSIAMLVFPVVILGGLDSVRGCMIAGPLVGALQMLAIAYIDPITEGGAGDVIPYVIIMLTLIFRPHGIFGQVHIERI